MLRTRKMSAIFLIQPVPSPEQRKCDDCRSEVVMHSGAVFLSDRSRAPSSSVQL